MTNVVKLNQNANAIVALSSKNVVLSIVTAMNLISEEIPIGSLRYALFPL